MDLPPDGCVRLAHPIELDGESVRAWQEHLADYEIVQPFAQLSRVSQLRNQAAHTHPLSRKEYSELQRLAFQGGPLGCGARNALLLAWRP